MRSSLQIQPSSAANRTAPPPEPAADEGKRSETRASRHLSQGVGEHEGGEGGEGIVEIVVIGRYGQF